MKKEEIKNQAMIFLGGVVFGGLIAWGLMPAPIESRLEKDERLFKFVDQDLRAYSESKSPQEKLHQADVLYQKAVRLFVVELDMKVAGLPPEAPASSAPLPEPTEVPAMDESDPSSGASKGN